MGQYFSREWAFNRCAVFPLFVKAFQIRSSKMFRLRVEPSAYTFITQWSSCVLCSVNGDLEQLFTVGVLAFWESMFFLCLGRLGLFWASTKLLFRRKRSLNLDSRRFRFSLNQIQGKPCAPKVCCFFKEMQHGTWLYSLVLLSVNGWPLACRLVTMRCARIDMRLMR